MKSNLEKLAVQIGRELTLNIKLSVTGAQEVITVAAEAIAVQTENDNSMTSFSQKQVEDLPINIKGGSGNLNINGIPGASVLFTLNGADVMDPYNNLNNSGASHNTLGANEIAQAAVVINA